MAMVKQMLNEDALQGVWTVSPYKVPKDGELLPNVKRTPYIHDGIH